MGLADPKGMGRAFFVEVNGASILKASLFFLRFRLLLLSAFFV